MVTSGSCPSDAAACWERAGTAFCVHYHLRATAEGVCHIRIEFGDGSPAFATDVTFDRRYQGTCCDGFFAEGSDSIVVPDAPHADAGADASPDGD